MAGRCSHREVTSVYVANTGKHQLWQFEPKEGYVQLKQCRAKGCGALFMQCPRCPSSPHILEFRRHKRREMLHLNDCPKCPKIDNIEINKLVLCQHCKVLLINFEYAMLFARASKTCRIYIFQSIFPFANSNLPNAFRTKKDCPLVRKTTTYIRSWVYTNHRLTVLIASGKLPARVEI